MNKNIQREILILTNLFAGFFLVHTILHPNTLCIINKYQAKHINTFIKSYVNLYLFLYEFISFFYMNLHRTRDPRFHRSTHC